MIGRLHGIIIAKQAPDVLLDVNGVGYEIQVPMTTYYQLTEVGQKATLFTHLSVREDAQTLFGFHADQDKQLFRELIKINGVGPKMALGILSGMTPDELVSCVHQGNVTQLTKLPGVGKKTAERLLIDLKDRLKAWQTSIGTDAEASSTPDSDIKTAGHAQKEISSEASEALIALGYKPTEASKLVMKVQQEGMTVQNIIKAALKLRLK